MIDDNEKLPVGYYIGIGVLALIFIGGMIAANKADEVRSQERYHAWVYASGRPDINYDLYQDLSRADRTALILKKDCEYHK